MNIGGPFYDASRRKSPKKWYLSYFLPKKHPDGTVILVDGKTVLERKRPYYASEEDAAADKPAILAQYASAGASSCGGVLTRDQAAEFELAKSIAPEASLADLARFWRAHHPLQAVVRVSAAADLFLAATKARLGETAGYEDLKSRVGMFVDAFGERIPETISRGEFLRWLDSKPAKWRGVSRLAPSGRSILNLKQSACRFFNWMRAQEPAFVTHNPAGGITRAQLPKIAANEIRFLSLEEVGSYLRAAERYDPELVAHEVIQLLAGVRADDEMANFSGDFVFAATREIEIPASIAKKDRRDVINTLEPVFWEWWAVYGRKGILRPPNYANRWRRVRILAGMTRRDGAAAADALAGESVFKLQIRPDLKPFLASWPWNARRRTFCTYHVAKYQSADKTALILRHDGDVSTLHNSYRGRGVTQEQGAAFFDLRPQRVARPLLAGGARPPRGIVRFRLEEAEEKRESGKLAG